MPPPPRLAVFLRFPEPGRAKTRLIPVLGPEGAAALHRRLVERTLAVVRASGLPFELRTTGAPPAAFSDWLGAAAIVDQGEGDLGDRLRRAAACPPVLLIGTDAPDLSPDHLRDAAAHLRAGAPAVLGPAVDGGYWILGLSRSCDPAFAAVPWSTDRAGAETLSRLRAAAMPPVLLPTLSDLDRPEDLLRWPELSA